MRLGVDSRDVAIYSNGFPFNRLVNTNYGRTGMTDECMGMTQPTVILNLSLPLILSLSKDEVTIKDIRSWFDKLTMNGQNRVIPDSPVN